MVQQVDFDSVRHRPCGHLTESRQVELGEVDLIDVILEVDDGVVPVSGAKDEVIASGVADERVVASKAVNRLVALSAVEGVRA